MPNLRSARDTAWRSARASSSTASARRYGAEACRSRSGPTRRTPPRSPHRPNHRRQQPLTGRRPHRYRRYPTQRDRPVRHYRRDQGKVAVAAGELGETPTRRHRKDTEVISSSSASVLIRGPVNRSAAGAERTRPAHHGHRRTTRHGDHRQLGGRVGVRQTAGRRPLLRIAGCPIHRVASASSGWSVWVASALCRSARRRAAHR